MVQQTLSPQPLKIAYQLVALQGVFVIIVAILAYRWGIQAAYSVFLGGVVLILPNIWFAHRFIHRWRTRSIKQLASGLYLGELIKLLICGFLSAIFVKLVALDYRAFLLGLVSAQILYWILAPVMMYRINKGNGK
jgi:ATP synthase protein I